MIYVMIDGDTWRVLVIFSDMGDQAWSQMVCSGVMWLIVIVGDGFWSFWLIYEDMDFHKNSGNEKWTLSIDNNNMWSLINYI